MPREVIFGPESMGGRGIMDARLEQPIIHTAATIGHMRRNDSAGKALGATLRGHQVVAGISKSFLNVPPEDIPYMPSNTRWAYMASLSAQYEIKIQCYNEWLPKHKCRGDRVIMDTALQDEYFIHKKWKLEIINNCRLFLRVINLSDMAINNEELDNGYYNGGKRVTRNDIVFEEVEKPPPPAWREWKEFLFRNYIKGNNKLMHPLQQANSYTENHEANKEGEITIHRKDSLEATFNEIPQNMREIMGKVSLPNDGGKQLVEAINGAGLIGASDGSVKGDKDGSFAYSIQANNSDENRIMGYQKVPRSNEMSSLTSESYGMLGTLISIMLICTQHREQISRTGKIIVTSDNKEVIDRLENESQPLNTTETWKPDYDLWKLMNEIKGKIPVKVKTKWVKGHQDSLPNGDKIHGPFPREVELNILMDKYAGMASDNSSLITPVRRTYKHTVIGMYDKNNEMITDLRKFLYTSVNGSKLQEYINKKYNWCEIEQSLINWEGLAQAMKKYSEYKKSKVIQLMYNWQNDGCQKQKFHAQADALCPAKCGEVETHNHYLRCNDKRMIQTRIERRRILRQHLNLRNTHPQITNAIILYLTKGPEETLYTLGEPTDVISKLIIEAVEENFHLNQASLEKGFTSKKWHIAQQEWARIINSDKGYKQKYWGRDLIIELQTYSYELWKTRNEILHGNTVAEQNKKKYEECKERIRELYKIPRTNLNEKEKKIFKLPLALRLKSSRQAMRLWIETAELCFQRAMENDERSKIKWYFPISKQIKQTEIQQRKSNNWNEQNQKKINEKRYKQTKIICCRPQGG